MMRAPALLALLALAAPAAAAPVRGEHIEAELVAEHSAWVPGAANAVALRLAPERGWHTYWRNPGDSGTATSLEWQLPAGWSAGEIQWPFPHLERIGELANYGYSSETLHLVELTAPTRVEGEQATVRALARWLVCADVCIPGQAELELTLPVARGQAPQDPAWAALFAQTRARLPHQPALGGRFAIAGGALHAELDAPGDTAIEGFFPFAGDLVNHAAPQRFERSGPTLRMAQPLNAYFSRAPERVDGVLVLAAGAPQAYAVSLQPGTVTPLAIPMAEAGAGPAAGGSVGLGLAVLLALAGGLILNLMPCVFPVLSIKAVAVLEAQDAQAQQQRAHALAYTSGVIASCVAIAVALVGFRAGGAAIGWGFQLQAPVFVAALAYLFFILGLSLSGWLQIGASVMGVGQSLALRGGLTGSFFTGVLAVVVASPCTAPFMGTALGYALTQPALAAVLIFAALGLGLALPFLVIGFVPAAARALPRPGAWMETFKQFMAFPLYLTVVWLVWVLGRQAGPDAAATVLAGVVLLGFAAWLLPHPQRLSRALRYAAIVAALALLAAPAVRSPAPRTAAIPAAADWQPWSEARVAELRAQGRAVFVNFTADWCITCKLNERVALNTDAVRDAFAARNVALLEADWTNADPAISAVLERFGHPGVPLYLLYPAHGEPRVLPQLLTPQTVIEAVAALPTENP